MAQKRTQSGAATASRGEIERLVLTERVSRLYASTAATAIPNLALLVIGWSIAFIAVWIVRLWLTRQYKARDTDDERSLYVWANLFIAVIAASGFMRAIGAVITMPGSSMFERGGTALILLGWRWAASPGWPACCRRSSRSWFSPSGAACSRS